VDRDLGEAELRRGLEAGVAADDHALFVHDDRLAEAEFAERGRHGIDGSVVVARVTFVRTDGIEGPEDDLHAKAPESR
jgi:hypothetical protein